MVTVLSKNQCKQCDFTKRVLTEKGIPFVEHNMEEDATALARAKELGYLQAPVVILPDGSSWSGFRPDMIATL